LLLKIEIIKWPFAQRCNNYKNWGEYIDKVYGIDNLTSLTILNWNVSGERTN